MQKFTLELLFHIIGVGSASGLFYDSGSLYIASDNSQMLYDYNLVSKTLTKTPLTGKDYTGPLETIPKKDKPDYEAIAANNDILYLFGSGSAQNRNRIGRINRETKEVLPFIDATDLYLNMQSFSEIAAQDFNIEAAFYDGESWYLLNRGNGPGAANGIFTLNGSMDETAFQIFYNEIKLPKIGGAQAGFTDVVKVGDKLYFIAAAEKSASTYADGAVTGTLIGSIDLLTVALDFTEVISTKNKFEGLTLYKESGNVLEFLLSEDTDNDAAATDIYKLTINK